MQGELAELSNLLDAAVESISKKDYAWTENTCRYVIRCTDRLQRNGANTGTGIGATAGFLVGSFFLSPLVLLVPTIAGGILGNKIGNVNYEVENVRIRAYQILAASENAKLQN